MSVRLFLRDFTIVDFAYLDPNYGPVGDSLYVSVELEGALDQAGFIYDFGPAKKEIKAVIDREFDHKFLVPQGTSREFAIGDDIYHYQSPSSALTEWNPEQSLRLTIENAVRATLPPNISFVKIHLREEARFQTEANFRYTHGLRYHSGNCQRLIHGHRNPIEVWQNKARLPEWETRLAEYWNNAHFTAAATLKNRHQLDLALGVRALENTLQAEIAYQSSQGEFSLSLPAKRVILVEQEPSIENMAALAVTTLKNWGLANFLVVAYEGLNKGAMATSEN